jgi:hypothetical protein
MICSHKLGLFEDHFLGTKGAIEHGTYRGDVKRGTYRKYENSLQLPSSYCDEHDISSVSRIDKDVVEDFRPHTQNQFRDLEG